MRIDQYRNESEFEYQKRIIYGKLVDKSLAEYDFAELAEVVYGKPYASDNARKMFYGSKRTLELLEEDMAKFAGAARDENPELQEIRKEQQALRDERTTLQALIRCHARHEYTMGLIKECINSSDLPVLSPPTKKQLNALPLPEDEHAMLVSLNDIHYGIEIFNNWNSYSPEIFSKMLTEYAEQIIAIQEKQNCRNCYVYNNGDSISGNIHTTISLANKENVVAQVKGVSELIAEFLAYLSPYFQNITYISTPGNHSRLSSKEDSPLDEHLDDLVGWYLEARLEKFPNIKIEEANVGSTIFKIDILGKTYVGVHGDLDATSRNKIDVSALQTMVGSSIYAVLLGHKHHNLIESSQGVKIIMAGSFVGMDDYCVSKRIIGHAEQLVCICDSSGMICSYDIHFQSNKPAR